MFASRGPGRSTVELGGGEVNAARTPTPPNHHHPPPSPHGAELLGEDRPRGARPASCSTCSTRSTCGRGPGLRGVLNGSRRRPRESSSTRPVRPATGQMHRANAFNKPVASAGSTCGLPKDPAQRVGPERAVVVDIENFGTAPGHQQPAARRQALNACRGSVTLPQLLLCCPGYLLVLVHRARPGALRLVSSFSIARLTGSRTRSKQRYTALAAHPTEQRRSHVCSRCGAAQHLEKDVHSATRQAY